MIFDVICGKRAVGTPDYERLDQLDRGNTRSFTEHKRPVGKVTEAKSEEEGVKRLATHLILIPDLPELDGV